MPPGGHPINGFDVASVTVPAGARCEDRVAVIEFDGGVTIVVADGAGGTGAGDRAAEIVIRDVTAVASPDYDAGQWCAVLRQTDQRIGTGESTAVVITRTRRAIVGASVGDSRAWLFENDDIVDLTASQVRKPLLGSGDARPVGFSHPPSAGLLLVCTDGFANYVRREKLLQEIAWIEFAVMPAALVDTVRLPSGAFWDDVAIVVCRPGRDVSGRRRYQW